MNLVYRYLEQRGITPHQYNTTSHMPWENLRGFDYTIKVDPIPVWHDPNYRMATYEGYRTITANMTFEIHNTIEPMHECDAILAPSHEELTFDYCGHHITLVRPRMTKYELENDPFGYGMRLNIEFIAEAMIVDNHDSFGR